MDACTHAFILAARANLRKQAANYAYDPASPEFAALPPATQASVRSGYEAGTIPDKYGRYSTGEIESEGQKAAYLQAAAGGQTGGLFNRYSSAQGLVGGGLGAALGGALGGARGAMGGGMLGLLLAVLAQKYGYSIPGLEENVNKLYDYGHAKAPGLMGKVDRLQYLQPGAKAPVRSPADLDAAYDANALKGAPPSAYNQESWNAYRALPPEQQAFVGQYPVADKAPEAPQTITGMLKARYPVPALGPNGAQVQAATPGGQQWTQPPEDKAGAANAAAEARAQAAQQDTGSGALTDRLKARYPAPQLTPPPAQQVAEQYGPRKGYAPSEAMTFRSGRDKARDAANAERTRGLTGQALVEVVHNIEREKAAARNSAYSGASHGVPEASGAPAAPVKGELAAELYRRKHGLK